MVRYKWMCITSATSAAFLLSSGTLMAEPTTGTAPPAIVAANLVGLVTHPAVQAELKITEPQKIQLDKLVENAEEQRLQWFERMGISRPEGTKNHVASNSRPGFAPVDTTESSARRPAGFVDPLDLEPRDPFAAMLASRQQLEQATERSIARILSRAQLLRALQIQLQLHGLAALWRSDMQERLSLTEDQLALLHDLMLERQVTLREIRDARQSLKQAALNRDPALSHFHDPDGRISPVNASLKTAAYQEARRKALQRLHENPALLKQLAELRDEQDRAEKRFNATLHSKVLTGRQSQAYQKMLGVPFDPAQSQGASSATRDDSPHAKSPLAKDPSSVASKPTRNTLREQRGLGSTGDE
jgi:hypothetical protein